MQVETAWVKPPPQVGGLDHLAVQAPCINIYGRLLPGITNVTDRARYYSFYPWLIWTFDQAGFTRYDDEFIERFRRADCLFCLIAHRHAHACDDGHTSDHAAAMVGSDTLAQPARDLGRKQSLRLSDYSLRDGAKKRYFANRLGGLGQYYIGVLRELSVLDGDAATGIRYTRQIGQVIAETMDAAVPRDRFLQVVESDRVTGDDLDELAAFCPCQLTVNKAEQGVLGELFFARGAFHDMETMPRRRSLQLILHLCDALSKSDAHLSEANFRACVYTHSLPNGRNWKIPSNLDVNRDKWTIYARNELLSIAVQGLFFAVLDAYEASGERFESTAQIVEWYLKEPEIRKALTKFNYAKTWSELVRKSDSWLPALKDWQAEMHEVQLVNRIARLSRAERGPENRRDIVIASLRTLIALVSRVDLSTNQYGTLVFEENYFHYYPINLQTMARQSASQWTKWPIQDVARWLLSHWGIDTHLRVALRKLRGNSLSTFRIRPSDKGMEVIAVPEAVHTRPRFSQAYRILKDLGAIERTADGSRRLSQLGLDMLELGDAS